KRTRQERAAAVRDLARELEDLGLRQLPRLGVEIPHLRQVSRDRCQLELAEERHQDLLPLKAGMTSFPKSLRLASTSACGIASAVLIRKLTRSTPHASQRLSARVTRSGPPRQRPSPACSEASGPVAWRRSCGKRPSDGYDLDGYVSRTDMSCAARELKWFAIWRPVLRATASSSWQYRKLRVDPWSFTNSPPGSQSWIRRRYSAMRFSCSAN